MPSFVDLRGLGGYQVCRIEPLPQIFKVKKLKLMIVKGLRSLEVNDPGDRSFP
jgi:hypothetical protein